MRNNNLSFIPSEFAHVITINRAGKMVYPAVDVLMADGSTYTIRHGLLADGDSNAKLAKSDKYSTEYLTFGMSLASANLSGFNVCRGASAGCIKSCLLYAGQGRFENVKNARIAKTRLFFQDRTTFKAMLYADVYNATQTAAKVGKLAAIRLNVLSDLPWERIFPQLFAAFPEVQFYDYTKVADRIVPTNYYLTFSRSESNEALAIDQLSKGYNVAVVFESKDLPSEWNGYPVINGDKTDLRFTDERNSIVGLYAKGKAKTDSTGFVVRSAPIIALDSLRSR